MVRVLSIIYHAQQLRIGLVYHGAHAYTGLHEDLNRVHTKPAWFELEDIDGESDAAKALRYWTYNIERNSSLVGDLFAGQLMSVLICTRCKRRSSCFDPCWDVSVQLPARGTINRPLITMHD